MTSNTEEPKQKTFGLQQLVQQYERTKKNQRQKHNHCDAPHTRQKDAWLDCEDRLHRRGIVDAGCAELTDSSFGFVDVVDEDVEVKLLRAAGVGESRWSVLRRVLEREPATIRIGQHHPRVVDVYLMVPPSTPE